MHWDEVNGDDVLHTTIGDTICSGVGWLVGSVHSGPVLSGCPVNPALLPGPPPSVMTSTSPRITSNDQKFSPVSRQLCSPNSLEWNAMKFYPVLVYLTLRTPITHSDVFIQVPFNLKCKLRLDNAPYLIEAAFWKLGKCWGSWKSALLTHLRI